MQIVEVNIRQQRRGYGLESVDKRIVAKLKNTFERVYTRSHKKCVRTVPVSEQLINAFAAKIIPPAIPDAAPECPHYRYSCWTKFNSVGDTAVK